MLEVVREFCDSMEVWVCGGVSGGVLHDYGQSSGVVDSEIMVCVL